jgi:3-methyladenine DNA glycosylase AlkD
VITDYEGVMERLRLMADPAVAACLPGQGIGAKSSLGVSVDSLKALQSEIGKSHELASRLWGSGVREARILASMVDVAEKVTSEQMDGWASGFDSWDVCDQCCCNLFWMAPLAYKKALQWSGRPEEFVRRAGFVLMGELAIRDGDRKDEVFVEFLPVIVGGAQDGRAYVKKAVGLALKRIGGRNINLNRKAVEVAAGLAKSESKDARLVGSDALWELTGEGVRRKLRGAG